MVLEKRETIIGLFILLVVGFFLYANINGLPQTHPGNIKAADPFYHTSMTQSILDTQQFKYYPLFIAQDKKIIDIIPPLLNINAAGVSALAMVPSWFSTYYVTVLSFVLILLFVYLITKEAFENENVALLATMLMVLPPPVQVWMYSLYIGFWIQVVSFTFVLCYLWLFLRYIKRGETVSVFGMSLCILISALAHPQELLIYFPSSLFILFKIARRTDSWSVRIQQLVAYCTPIILIFFVELPWFIYAWGKTGSYDIGWYGLQSRFPTDYLGGLTTPHISNLPWLYLCVYVLGLIVLLFFTKKKHWVWIGATAYFFAYMYVLPQFLSAPHYIGRTRWFVIPIIMPTLAYFLYVFLRTFIMKESVIRIILFSVGVLIILFALPGYFQLVQGVQGEHIDKEKWVAYTWVQENTPANATLLFVGGCGQANCVMMKRSSMIVRESELGKTLSSIWGSRKIPENIIVDLATDTFYDYPVVEKSFLRFEPFNKNDFRLNNSNSITMLWPEYIFMENINVDVKNVNYLILNLLNLTHIPVYSTERFLILKRVSS